MVALSNLAAWTVRLFPLAGLAEGRGRPGREGYPYSAGPIPNLLSSSTVSNRGRPITPE
jgi:hypothetical protein